MSDDEKLFQMPFNPQPREFAGHPMPAPLLDLMKKIADTGHA
ncbi:hypothetical protein [Brevibacterium sp. ZH18]|nr:hypothetical protein [Brevibacterium sp. ZH18]